MSRAVLIAAAAFCVAWGASSGAAHSLFITEIHSAGSANGTYGADWFELTNTGPTTISIAGWKVDDNSESPFGAVPLRGVTSIAPGQSVVFIESDAAGADDAAIQAAFRTAWFGGAGPAGLVLGNYGGIGVGLDDSTDAVNIFNGSLRVANVFVGPNTAGRTFDNNALVEDNFTALTTLSVAGVNGAFLSANGLEIGSPGLVTIPEPLTCALWAGVGVCAQAALRRRSRKRA
jgi:hypothetical protein